MNLKGKAFLLKFHVKESSILIGLENFGATEFSIMGWLGWYSFFLENLKKFSAFGAHFYKNLQFMTMKDCCRLKTFSPDLH